MKTIKNTLVHLTLVCLLSGCTTYRAVEFDFQDPPDSPAETLELKIGQKLRVRLQDGIRETGKVLWWDERSLTLDTDLSIDQVKEKVLFWEEMETIEVSAPSEGKTAVMVVAGMAIVGTSVALSQMDPMGNR